MATAIFMPKAGMAMEEGTLVRWLKNVGDAVEMNEPIMEIETDKIAMESEAPATGVLLAKLVEEGTVVPVLETIGWIGSAGERVPNQDAQQATPSTDAFGTPAAAPAAAPVAASSATIGLATPYAKKLAREQGVALSGVTPSGRHGEIIGADIERAAHITPLAQRIAAEHGVDTAAIAGTGFAGKLVKQDVLTAMAKQGAQTVAEPDTETRTPMPGRRKVLAARMVQSHTQIPAVTQNIVIDMTELISLRTRLNQNRAETEKFSLNDFLLRACTIAVYETPCMRTSLDGDTLVVKNGAHIGFAVGTEDSLLVPVLHNAQRMTFPELSATAKDLAKRARSGGLRIDEMGGSTFTISNLGMYEVESFTPMINMPDAAILGAGCIRDELALSDGNVVVKKVMRLCLSYDHRILDGVLAAKFCLRLKQLLENPLDLLM